MSAKKDSVTDIGSSRLRGNGFLIDRLPQRVKGLARSPSWLKGVRNRCLKATYILRTRPGT